MNAVEMDVPERHGDLQRQRGERQTTSKPSVVKNPTHQAKSTLTASRRRPLSLCESQLHTTQSG